MKEARKPLAEAPDLPAFLKAAEKTGTLGKPLMYEAGPDGERVRGEFGYGRCVCGRVSAAQEPLTMMWCECCRGHILWMWENLLERPVQVDLYESAVTGSGECRFVVTF